MLKKEFFELYKKIGIPVNEASAELDMIFDYLNINPLDEFKNGDFKQGDKQKILNIVKERTLTKKPLQYILGFGYFMGEKFFVDKNTLIPRPETEILVKECLNLIFNEAKVLDIGTGSGCIAIEIAKNSKAKVDAVDISEEALIIAKKNANFHNVKCNFFKSDLFSNVTQKYDFIVSNPPYIPYKDINTISDIVKNFEPHAALFANDELGINFYKKIIDESVTFLNKNGHIIFELGINQSGLISQLFKDKGFSDIKILKDLDNIERVVLAKYF